MRTIRFILVTGYFFSLGCKNLERHPYSYGEVCSSDRIEDGYYVAHLKYLDEDKAEIEALSLDDNYSRTWIKVINRRPELEAKFIRPNSLTTEGKYMNEQIDRIRYVEVEGCQGWTFELDLRDELRHHQSMDN